jgi:hypothetical protein
VEVILKAFQAIADETVILSVPVKENKCGNFLLSNSWDQLMSQDKRIIGQSVCK